MSQQETFAIIDNYRQDIVTQFWPINITENMLKDFNEAYKARGGTGNRYKLISFSQHNDLSSHTVRNLMLG